MTTLRTDAISIWRAGVQAVDAATLVSRALRVEANSITVGSSTWQANSSSQICVVGGGKAGTGMVNGLEQQLGSDWLARTSGWVNVPAGTETVTRSIHLHPARPAGVNEPRLAGVAGTQEILRRVAACGPDDLCLVLLSGGGSALLPAPREGITLDDKIAVTRALSRAGATIQQLNAVRRPLSAIKGGGLLKACRAGMLLALIISDVIGDPLDVIASGPTWLGTEEIPSLAAQRALDVLQLLLPADQIPPRISTLLQQQLTTDAILQHTFPRSENCLIGNNQTAVLAAVTEAQRLGYHVVGQEWDRPGVARDIGVELAARCLQLRATETSRRVCLISGGEPIVRLRETDRPQTGGRNQELVLAAICRWWSEPTAGMVLLSGGTDGEDGPTDAAGAFVDTQVIQAAKQAGLAPDDALEWNNSYPFFERCNGLLKTGPTGTNVMDLRVALIDPQGTSECQWPL